MTQLTFGQIEDLWVRNGGNPAWAPLAAGIAIAESGGNTAAWNRNAGTGDDSVGLWQINYFGNLAPSRTQAYGSPQALSADPNLQAQAAVKLSGNGADWSPWRTDRAWSAWQQAGAPPDPNSTTVQSWLQNAGLGTGGAAATSLPPGTTAPSTGTGNQGTATDLSNVTVQDLNAQSGNTQTILPGIPSSAPPIPGIDIVNPVGSLSSMIAWFGEFAGWAFLTLIIFTIGSAMLFLGMLGLIYLFASPALGPLSGVVGKIGPEGKAAGLAMQLGGKKKGSGRSGGGSSSSVGRQANPGRAATGAGRTTSGGAGRTAARGVNLAKGEPPPAEHNQLARQMKTYHAVPRQNTEKRRRYNVPPAQEKEPAF